MPCVAFEEVPPNQIQFAPSDLIIYDTPNDNCEYALKLKKKFIELPLGLGYTFQVKKKIEAFVEARYAPILTIKSFRNLEDLMIGTSYIQSSAKTWVHSRKKISIRSGFLKTINKHFLLKLGILLKSNDFGFDKMLVGENVGIQYTFHPKVK